MLRRAARRYNPLPDDVVERWILSNFTASSRKVRVSVFELDGRGTVRPCIEQGRDVARCP